MSDYTKDKEIIEAANTEYVRDIATEFFYDWYNSLGDNTHQGFSDWWELNRSRFGETPSYVSELVQKAQRCDELEKALRYVIEDLELRAHTAGTNVVELGSGAYEQAKGLLK